MQVNIHEAKTHFSKLIEKVAKGEEVTIAKAGKPVAKLVSVAPQRVKRKWKTDPRFQAAAEYDWFAPDPEIEKQFYGE